MSQRQPPTDWSFLFVSIIILILAVYQLIRIYGFPP